MRWTYKPPPTAKVEALSLSVNVSQILAELLLCRDVSNEAMAEQYLEPALASLHDPFLLPNLALAATCLRQAIAQE